MTHRNFQWRRARHVVQGFFADVTSSMPQTVEDIAAVPMLHRFLWGS